MSLERLNRWLSLAANFGVLAGIALVVMELRQTREMMRAQTRNEVAVQLVDLLRAVSTDPGLAHVMGLAFTGEELSSDETRQFSHRATAMFRYFENVHYQYRQQLYDEAEFATQQEAWRRFMRNAGYAAVWCSGRDTFSAEFRAAFDQLLPQPC